MDQSLIDAFYNLAKINKIELSQKANFDAYSKENIELVSKNLSLKDMFNLSLTNKKMSEIMRPIINKKREELESLRVWLSKLPNPKNYSLEQLDGRESLDLYYNNLTNLPELNLPNLKRVFLSNNQLTSLPKLDLPNLQILDLNNNELTNLQDLNLPNLKILNLNDNPLTDITELNLPKLQELYIVNNLLTEISNLNLPNLKQIYIGDNQLTEKSIEYLKSLKIYILYL